MRRSILLIVLGLIALSASSPDTQAQEKKPLKDAFGDPLPPGAIARIGAVRYRLPDGNMPESGVVSPDGKLFAFLGFQDEIEIMELPAWKRHRLIVGQGLDQENPSTYQGLAFSADSKRLVTLDAARQEIHFLEVSTGKSIKKIVLPKKKDQQVQQPFLKWSLDQQTLICSSAVADAKGQTQQYLVWDLAKDKLVRSFNIPRSQVDDGSQPPIISADCRWLTQGASQNDPAGQNGILAFLETWDLSTGKSVGKFATDLLLPKFARSPDGKWLAATDGHLILRIYDAATGKEQHNIRLRRTSINHLEFSPDSSSLFVAELEGKIHQWNPVSGERIASNPIPIGSAVRQLIFPADGKALAFGFSFAAIDLWEVATGKLFSPAGVPTSEITEVMFSPQQELLVASADETIAWWNPRTGVKLRELKLEVSKGNEGLLREGLGGGPRVRGDGGIAAILCSGEFLTSFNGVSTAFHESKTGKLLYDDNVYGPSATTMTFFDAGNQSASLQNKKIRVWNTRTGRDITHSNLPLRDKEQGLRLAASAKGKHFAVSVVNQDGGIPGRVLLWDADRKKVAREWPGMTHPEFMLFSPDHQWLALGGPTAQVQLHHLDPARRSTELHFHEDVNSVTQLAFSPDGRQLACAALLIVRDKNVGHLVVYEMASKKIRLVLAGHENGVIERLAYAYDSGLLASGATDTTALVWNAGLRAFAVTPADKEATQNELNEHLEKMGDQDAAVAFQSMIKLVQFPKQAVAYLADKIPPAKKVESGEKAVPQWIQDLGSSQFTVRNKASAILVKIGASVEPALREALPKAKDVETKRRIGELLERFAANEWTVEELLHARAVEVVEAIATPESRALLTRWSAGEPEAVLTREASKALKQGK